MIYSLKMKLFLVVSSVMVLGLNAYAQENTTETTGNKNKETIEKYLEETTKLREEHNREMRELHLKYINTLYDKKSEFNTEMKELWAKENPTDLKAINGMKKKIKGAHRSARKAEEKRQDEFENLLKDKNKEFRKLMRDKISKVKDELK